MYKRGNISLCKQMGTSFRNLLKIDSGKAELKLISVVLIKSILKEKKMFHLHLNKNNHCNNKNAELLANAALNLILYCGCSKCSHNEQPHLLTRVFLFRVPARHPCHYALLQQTPLHTITYHVYFSADTQHFIAVDVL